MSDQDTNSPSERVVHSDYIDDQMGSDDADTAVVVGDDGFIRLDGPLPISERDNGWSLTYTPPHNVKTIGNLKITMLSKMVGSHIVAIHEGEAVAGGKLEKIQDTSEGNISLISTFDQSGSDDNSMDVVMGSFNPLMDDLEDGDVAALMGMFQAERNRRYDGTDPDDTTLVSEGQDKSSDATYEGLDEWRLCLIRDQDTAIFTNADSFDDLQTQDWYKDHNALAPYESDDYDTMRIMFRADSMRKPQTRHMAGRRLPPVPNDVNDGKKPWLIEVDEFSNTIHDGETIETRATPEEFITTIEKTGGTAYIPASNFPPTESDQEEDNE